MTSFEELLIQFKSEFELHLEKSLSDANQPEELVNAVLYSLMVGGKRIRPFLVRAAAKACGVTDDSWIWPAAAIEMIHTYSLIHDDLPAMDDDVLRRGQATCHIKYGEALAILAGDGLQMKAIECIVSAPEKQLSMKQKLEQISSISKASGFSGMVGGQALDLAAEGKSIGLQALTRVHSLKTGALIASAVEMGCLCQPDISVQSIKNARHFGELIGLAFQVVDDILDIEGNTEILGKSQGADIEHNKSTFPALMGLEPAKTYARQLFDESIAVLDGWQGDTSELKSVAEFVLSRNH